MFFAYLDEKQKKLKNMMKQLVQINSQKDKNQRNQSITHKIISPKTTNRFKSISVSWVFLIISLKIKEFSQRIFQIVSCCFYQIVKNDRTQFSVGEDSENSSNARFNIRPTSIMSDNIHKKQMISPVISSPEGKNKFKYRKVK